MENIVYILGAGFSQPLGLPVISDFIQKAHDIYDSDNEQFAHFDKVFQSINQRLAQIKFNYKSNLDNIEEVLSVLEMERLVGISGEETNDFKKFLKDVIQHSTPEIRGLELLKRNDHGVYEVQKREQPDQLRRLVFASDGYFNYHKFALTVLGRDIDVNAIIDPEYDNTAKVFKYFTVVNKKSENKNVKYSVISLNYDMVLEKLAEYYSIICNEKTIKFQRPPINTQSDYPILTKLHGSIDTDTIVPPTWNKTLHEKINLEWKIAYEILSKANHIRFIGYSLPDGDSYIRYLLKSSVTRSRNLKRIDVLCYDPYGTARARYKEFISDQPHAKYRFSDSYTQNYLDALNIENFEDRHNSYFNTYSN